MTSVFPPLRLHNPVVVALAPVGETRWGYHQFVSISPCSGGRILLRYHAVLVRRITDSVDLVQENVVRL